MNLDPSLCHCIIVKINCLQTCYTIAITSLLQQGKENNRNGITSNFVLRIPKSGSRSFNKEYNNKFFDNYKEILS